MSARGFDPDARRFVNLPDDPNTAPTLEDYRRGLAEVAKAAGQERVRVSDPDAFDDAVAAVRAAATEYPTFSADDVFLVGRGNEVGAAFSRLRKAGEIEVAGYAVSRRPAAHGRLVRVWRAT